MKVRDLISKLEDIIDDLNCYDEDDEIRVSCNTYGMGSNFLATYDGYIDLSDPVKEEEDY